ncbi:MAG: hypothetical protein KGO02_11475, partial [Alphaproteobacteria bacterium]|nr:hypothetical protein [Alphaproteobacteria bacterium]
MTVFKDAKIRCSRVAVLFACIAFLTTAAARAANDNDTVAAICAAWKRRYDATRSVHCVVTGKRLFPKDTYGAQADHEAPLRCTWKLDLQRNRFRFECRDETYREDKKAWLPQWEDTVFDGRIVKVHHAGITAKRADWPDRQAEFAVHPSNYQCFLIFDCPVFLSLGIMPAYGTESNSTMRRPLYPETFTVHGRGTTNGRECVILRSKPRQPVPRVDEYWVDLERGATIMRWRQFPVSGERADIECDIDYKEFSNGWQPSRFTTSSFTSNGKLVQHNQVAVTDFLTNADLDEATFELEPRAGMYFNDGIKLRLYQVAVDGRFVDPPPLGGPMTSNLKGSKAPELSGKVWLN